MNLFLYAITICIWGSTWLAITHQLGTIPIDISIFYRFGLASLLVFIWCFFRKKSLKFPWFIHLSFVAQGFFLFSINFTAAYAASYYIPSGLNAIGFSMVLVFNIINSFIFYRVPITLPVACGALSGIIGVATIFWPSIATLDLSSNNLLGIFLSLLGGALASFGNMISVQNQKKKIPVCESNAYAMGYGALIMLGIIFFKGIPLQIDMSNAYIFSLLHLSIFGSIIAFGCYLTLLGRIGPHKASYALVMVPVIALGLSTLFENFVWDFHTFSGVGLIMLGNLIILVRKPLSKTKVLEEEKPLLQTAFKKAA
jgi:drug/metabolite transporter (DMT)-like permease